MDDSLKVIYITHVGVDSDGLNVYHFLISGNPDEVWKEGWEEIPACNINELQPDDSMYEYVKELKTDIKLDLAQDQCCFSMSDVKERICALAWENILDYEEYPDDRIVIHYGEPVDMVEESLKLRDLEMHYI